MEEPPITLESFKKWKKSLTIIKESDMEVEMREQAVEIISNGIEMFLIDDDLDI